VSDLRQPVRSSILRRPPPGIVTRRTEMKGEPVTVLAVSPAANDSALAFEEPGPSCPLYTRDRLG